MRNLLRIAAALALLSTPALAETGTLTVAGYAGSFEILVRSDIIPAFEKKFGVKVDYVAGNSSETLARLQAPKASPAIDVAIADQGPMHQALRLGLCAPIEGLPSADLYESARFEGDKAVSLGLGAVGFVYDTRYFREKGWAAPTSWNDLKDPKFRKLIVIPPFDTDYGLSALVMSARLNGGGESNIDPGFKVMKDQIDGNVLAYETKASKIEELFLTGQSRLVVWTAGRAQSIARTGFPVGFAYPKEGAVASSLAACPVARDGASPLASAFIKAMLDVVPQLSLLKDYGYGPASRKTAVPPELAEGRPVGERAAALISLDWDAINAQRDDWRRRWIREIGR